eukprot:3499503-Rhodomonas_salina.6
MRIPGPSTCTASGVGSGQVSPLCAYAYQHGYDRTDLGLTDLGVWCYENSSLPVLTSRSGATRSEERQIGGDGQAICHSCTVLRALFCYVLCASPMASESRLRYVLCASPTPCPVQRACYALRHVRY